MAEKAPWEVDDTAPWSVDDTAAPAAAAPKRGKGESFLRGLTATGISENLTGLGETALGMATGTVGQAVGGLHGLVNLVRGKGLDEAVRASQETSNVLTYQPRSEQGKNITEGLGTAFEAANQGLGTVGEAVGGNVGRSIGETAIPVATTVLGGRGALVKGRQVANDLATRRMTPTEAEIAFARQNEGKLDALKLAKQHGIVVDPVEVNPSVLNRSIRSVAGEQEATNTLSRANEGRWGEMLKDDLGIHRDAQLNKETLTAVRDAAAAPMNEVRGLGTLGADEATINGIAGLRVKSMLGNKASASRVNTMVNEALDMVRNGMDASDVIDNIQSLRKKARDIYNKSDAGPELLAEAEASMGIANKLEGMVETNLYGMAERNPYGNFDSLLQRFRDGRTRMAKSYALEDAMDFNTGKVDPAKIAKKTAEDNALTGNFADVGKIAGNFPSSSRIGAAMPSPLPDYLRRTTLAGSLGSTIGGSIAGLPGVVIGGTAGAGVSNILGHLLAKNYAGKGIQRRAASPVSAEYLRKPTSPLTDVPPEVPPIQREFNQPTGQRLLTGPETPPTQQYPVPSQRPDWQYYQQPPGDGTPPSGPSAPSGPGAPQLPEFSAEQVMGVVKKQRQQEYDAAKAADLLRQAEAEAAALRNRKPTGEGVILGKQPPSGTSLPKQSALETAVRKIASGRQFDLTAEERIAWNKAKGEVANAP